MTPQLHIRTIKSCPGTKIIWAFMPSSEIQLWKLLAVDAQALMHVCRSQCLPGNPSPPASAINLPVTGPEKPGPTLRTYNQYSFPSCESLCYQVQYIPLLAQLPLQKCSFFAPLHLSDSDILRTRD